MKKKINIFSLIFILIYIYACAGYEPIFSSSNLQFEIVNYKIEGNNELSNKLNSKISKLSKSSKKNPGSMGINIMINVSKNKVATVKNSAGKVLEYKININANVIAKDYLTNKEILNNNFNSSLSYEVRDQHSETIKIENQKIEDLLNEIYRNLLIQLSQKTQSQ